MGHLDAYTPSVLSRGDRGCGLRIFGYPSLKEGQHEGIDHWACIRRVCNCYERGVSVGTSISGQLTPVERTCRDLRGRIAVDRVCEHLAQFCRSFVPWLADTAFAQVRGQRYPELLKCLPTDVDEQGNFSNATK